MQEVNDAVEMREKSVPLYYQVETILRKKILMGEFPVGKPLPSEESLAKAYDVSRITIRTALLNLQKEGLIFRKRGKGTFVSKNLSDLESPEYSGFIEDLIYMGIVTDIKLVKSDWVKPDEEIKKALRILFLKAFFDFQTSSNFYIFQQINLFSSQKPTHRPFVRIFLSSFQKCQIKLFSERQAFLLEYLKATF